ncbi:MAG: ATP-dependent protease LonB [Peptococcaceae bacterium]|nr:ATP-dependent protease LonB [Peptococcaceae bacterium]MDH7524205.1 ATP-dependent protease LonB [Peptococcaceae bacterium]
MIQIFFIVVVGLYFLNLLRGQQGSKIAVTKESSKELEKLEKMRRIKLSEPLAERTRPATFSDIVGQEEGIQALRAALCGPHPQHVIVYGPPGVGKTAAARLVLEEAKKSPHSPFNEESKFLEVDGATSRFDERGIADPLIGSVHDPIYQGAGAMGIAGIPQPKPGAVTKAHGGILFIDEIGELHPIQINKLLKVLEDRKVILESAYYSSEDTNIPGHIHDIFQNGLPADFRLIAATTRQPQEIPPAIRSRCVEIYFRSLLPHEISVIGEKAARKIGLPIKKEALDVLVRYATNGREAVNIIQIAAGIVIMNNGQEIKESDVEWVVNYGRYSPRPDKKIPPVPQVGQVNGLAVYGPNMGMLLEIEVCVIPAEEKNGKIIITGIVEEEEMHGMGGQTVRRKSMAKGSVENVLTVLRHRLNLDCRNYDIHVNFPGGIPADGPSAGVAIAAAIYSAVNNIPVDNEIAMTGEVSIRGAVKPVGGILAKIEAARLAGASRVLIPKDNWQSLFAGIKGIKVIPVQFLEEIIEQALIHKPADKPKIARQNQNNVCPLIS